MDYLNLNGKAFIVTGASSGIGKEICHKISNFHGKVIAVGRDESRLKDTLNCLGKGDHYYIKADLSTSNAIKEIVDKVAVINGIVHSAGYNKLLTYKFITEEEINKIFAINYNAPILLTKELINNKKVANNSSIIFISSISANISSVGNTMYSGTKGALNSSARALALEYASKKVRVNCIAPGIIKTPLFYEMATKIPTEKMRNDENNYPLGYGYPEDVANLALFLLSEVSRWITGTTITIDGGFTCK